MPVCIRGPVVYPTVAAKPPAKRPRVYLRGRPWTFEEKDFLDKNFRRLGPGPIAEKFNRTIGAVNHMASIRGLTGKA
jgi:hypothetical protein